LLKLQEELDTQKENLSKSYDLQIKAIEAKIKGITVN